MSLLHVGCKIIYAPMPKLSSYCNDELICMHVLFFQGVVIKYNEPEEARIPKTRWRLYGFKGEETLRKCIFVLSLNINFVSDTVT